MDDLIIKLKALADNNRLQIITLLLNENYCVSALAKKLNITKAAVSQHLKILRTSGLVVGEKVGYYTHYNVQKDILNTIGINLQDLASSTKTHGCTDECSSECPKL